MEYGDVKDTVPIPRASEMRPSLAIYSEAVTPPLVASHYKATANVPLGLPLDPSCKPLNSVDELESWKPDGHFSCRAKIPLDSHSRESSKPKFLVCHDMMGGYIDSDRYVQGSLSNDGYLFWQWWQLDTFVYFSHHLVTIPPACWIDAGHKHSVSVLGTLIVEWDSGQQQLRRILRSEDHYKAVANKLVEIAQFYGFDGWLLNIECELEPKEVDVLRHFTAYLAKQIHCLIPNSLILWYDSVIETGKLQWQNELNVHNKQFFDECDGIFLNYCWKDENLIASRDAAQLSNRQCDVYVGVDVFGRGCPGGGGFNSCEAVKKASQLGLSTALFAPGWVYEKKNYSTMEQYIEMETRFWSLLRNFCLRKPVVRLPLITSFCRGWGSKYHLYGHTILDHPWTNISLQQLQPTNADISGDCRIDWTHNDAFIGGQSLQLISSSSATVRLFEVDSTQFNSELFVSYTFKVQLDQVGRVENSSLGVRVALILTYSSPAVEDSGAEVIQHLVGPDENSNRDDGCKVVCCSSRTGHHGWITRDCKLVDMPPNRRLSSISVSIAVENTRQNATVLMGEFKVCAKFDAHELVLPKSFSGCLVDELRGDAIEAGKVLSWTEPVQMSNVVSHYIVYQSTCKILNEATNALADRCPLDPLNECSETKTVGNIVSPSTSCPPGCAPSAAGHHWQCIGLTPSSCFLVTTPTGSRTSLAVLPVSSTNLASLVAPVEIDVKPPTTV